MLNLVKLIRRGLYKFSPENTYQYWLYTFAILVKLIINVIFDYFYIKSLAKLRKIDIIVYVNKKEVLMNKEELVKEVAKKAKVSQKAAADVIAATLETVTKTVSKGQKVTLVGFGTFEPRKRAARSGRNPQTGATIKIAAKTVPAFSAGKKFKEAVK